MGLIRLLHVSDLHLSKTDKDQERKKKTMDRFYDKIAGIVDEYNIFNHIVFTGDLVNDNVDIDEFRQIMEKIIIASGIKESSDIKPLGVDYKKCVHIIPGHSDINCGVDDSKIDEIRRNYKSNSLDDFHELNDLPNRFYNSPFWQFYNDFYFGGDNPVVDSAWDENHYHGIRIVAGEDDRNKDDVIAFIYLNSCLFYTSTYGNNASDKMFFGKYYMNSLLNKADKANAKKIFIISHHSLEDIDNKDTDWFRNIIKSKKDGKRYYWLGGHKHKQGYLKEVEGFGKGKVILEICRTGSLTGYESNRPEFSYYVIDDNQDCERNLFVFYDEVKHGPGRWTNTLNLKTGL